MTTSNWRRNTTSVALDQYFALWSIYRWHVAVSNLATLRRPVHFVVSWAWPVLSYLFLWSAHLCQRIIRSIYLYPMAISFIVTVLAWKWIYNPGLGIQQVVHLIWMQASRLTGSSTPTCRSTRWSSPPGRQSSGFAMAIFLAGLRGVDQEIIKAARIDGAVSGLSIGSSSFRCRCWSSSLCL